MERGEFVKTCLLAGLAGPVIISIMESCSSVYYATSNISGKTIIIQKTEFIELKKGVSKLRSYVVVKNDSFPFPICIYRFNENEFIALSLICTHQGCELNPNEFTLTCPCHGSEFNNHGKVIGPPAEKDLDQFKVNTDDENIYVHLN